MAEVQITIGEGGAVVQDEAWAFGILRLNLPIEIDLIPVVDTSGLSFDQISPHGEAGLWKVERILEILGHDSAPVRDRSPVKIARVCFFAHACQVIRGLLFDTMGWFGRAAVLSNLHASEAVWGSGRSDVLTSRGSCLIYLMY